MSYRKTLKGDSNQANEEFSHNRINIVLGSSGVIAVCFGILLISAAIAWMMLKNGSLFSILIILSFLGVFIGAGIVGTCFIVVRISDALRDVRVNKILGTTIISGEVVSHYNGEEWDHLSAIHESAKIAQIAAPREMNTDESTILELYDKGMSLRAIEKQLKDAGVTYYQIQKVTAAHRK